MNVYRTMNRSTTIKNISLSKSVNSYFNYFIICLLIIYWLIGRICSIGNIYFIYIFVPLSSPAGLEEV